MGEFPLASQAFIYKGSQQVCIDISQEIKTFFRSLYDNGNIEGYSHYLIRDKDEALNEDLYVDEENERYPFLWVNITYRKDNAPLEEIESIREKYNLEPY